MRKKNNRRNQAILQFVLFAGILLFLNILGNARIGGRAMYGYIDMTEDQRYSLTSPTRELLRDLDDVVFVRVLLDGKFPAGFKRLQTSVREVLDDFRSEAGYIEYEFENPREGSVEEVNARTDQLAKDGIQPINLNVRDAEGRETRLIYPYAILYYKGRQEVVNLLENEVPGVSNEVILNNSIGLLEYKFANAIQKLQRDIRMAIALTAGHGELRPEETAGLERALRDAAYLTGRIDLDTVLALPPGEIAALVIAKPRSPFSEQEKFKIDQYVMQGGKVLWLLDPLRIDLDSLQRPGGYVPIEYDLNLEDLLFRYGVRIQPNLVLDLQSSRIPLTIGQVAGRPQIELFPYPYHPVVSPSSDHPVVNNLGPINLFYPATIDTTVRTKLPVDQTVLLASSPTSRLQYPPLNMNFDFLRYELDPDKFDKGPQPLCVLLEGELPSLYENRITPSMEAGLQELGMEFREQSVRTRMIVVSDGDVARNEMDPETNKIIPLGYNRFEKYQFANKEFLVNAVEYLLDEGGIIAARGKEVRLRLLDAARAREEKLFWQLLNIPLPLVLVVVFGLVYNYIRRRRFAR